MIEEKRFLQAVISVLALVPLGAGLAGVIQGPAFLRAAEPVPADLDSHLRFLSGVFLAMAIGWYSCVPAIERKGPRLRLLGLCTMAGGLARAGSIAIVGWPSAGHRVGLCLELAVVPLLLIWQARIERRSRHAVHSRA